MSVVVTSAAPPIGSTRVFLLSPAQCCGKRGQLLRGSSSFDLARRLRTGAGVPLGEVFAFLSGLYFRGKLTYARAFARSAQIKVITPSDGLRSPDDLVTMADLERYADVPISVAEERYRIPLERDLRRLAADLATWGDAQVVLLGSIATRKYTEVLSPHLGAALLYPRDFIGLGDMSRGAILLRHANAGTELEYAAVPPEESKSSRPRKEMRVDP